MPELCRGPEAVVGRLLAAGAVVLGCERLSTTRSSGACAYAGAFTPTYAWQPGKSCDVLPNKIGVQQCWAAISCLLPACLEPAQMLMPLFHVCLAAWQVLQCFAR